jgi:hypothetical protein
MPKYIVEWHRAERGQVEIEANSEDEARSMAYEIDSLIPVRSDFDVEVFLI